MEHISLSFLNLNLEPSCLTCFLKFVYQKAHCRKFCLVRVVGDRPCTSNTHAFTICRRRKDSDLFTQCFKDSMHNHTANYFKTVKRFNIPFRSRTVGCTTPNECTDYKVSKLFVENLTSRYLR